MIIHLTPTFINPYKNVKVILKYLSILAGDDNFAYQIPVNELALKNPYPNKSYYIACKKRGKKAFNGLYAHIDMENIKEFTVCEEWKTITNNGNEYTHFHYIRFNLLDSKFNSVTQECLLWGKYKPEIYSNLSSLHCTPKMEFDTTILKNSSRWYNEIEDSYYFNGIIKNRIEQYTVPTMPFQDLFQRGEDIYPSRMPDINIDGFNLTRDIINTEEIKEMNNQISKENAFLKQSVALDLPLDFCQTVYSFLLSSFITPEGFYQVFSDMYSNDTVFEYLEKMVKHNLLMIDEQDTVGLDDTCFLALNIEYDPNASIDDNSDEKETIQFALKSLKQIL